MHKNMLNEEMTKRVNDALDMANENGFVFDCGSVFAKDLIKYNPDFENSNFEALKKVCGYVIRQRKSLAHQVH